MLFRSTPFPLPLVTHSLPKSIKPPLPPPIAKASRDALVRKIPVVGAGSEGGELSRDVFLSTSVDGQVVIWDRRVKNGEAGGVRRLDDSSKNAGWCTSVRPANPRTPKNQANALCFSSPVIVGYLVAVWSTGLRRPPQRVRRDIRHPPPPPRHDAAPASLVRTCNGSYTASIEPPPPHWQSR
mgnify:CR=1 FL=1